MKIQILGTGCAKCNALTMATEKAAQSLGLPYELEKVTDLKQIMAFGVMTTPALAILTVSSILPWPPLPWFCRPARRRLP